jgi:hypothetical protein
MLTLFCDSQGLILEHSTQWGTTGNRVHCSRVLWGSDSNTFRVLSLTRPYVTCFESLKYSSVDYPNCQLPEPQLVQKIVTMYFPVTGYYTDLRSTKPVTALQFE